jgi:hypothetical protein
MCVYSAICDLQVEDGDALRRGRYPWNLLNKQSRHLARHGPLARSPAGRPQPLTMLRNDT